MAVLLAMLAFRPYVPVRAALVVTLVFDKVKQGHFAGF
jgi:hypothetical protein